MTSPASADGGTAGQAHEEASVGEPGQEHLRARGDADAVDQPACIEVAQDAAQVVVGARGGRPRRHEDVDGGVLDLPEQQLVGVRGPDGRVAACAESAHERGHGGAQGVADAAVAGEPAIEEGRTEDERSHDRRAHDRDVVMPPRRRQREHSRGDHGPRTHECVPLDRHGTLPHDACTEVGADTLVRDAGQGVVARQLVPAVGPLPHGAVLAGDDGIGVPRHRHAGVQGAGPAGRQDVEVVDEPGTLAADRVPGERGAVARGIVLHRDEVSGEDAARRLVEPRGRRRQRSSGSAGDVPRLLPGQDPVESVGAHGLMLARGCERARSAALGVGLRLGRGGRCGRGCGAGWAAGAGLAAGAGWACACGFAAGFEPDEPEFEPELEPDEPELELEPEYDGWAGTAAAAFCEAIWRLSFFAVFTSFAR